MRYLFIFLGIVLLGHGIYLMFGGLFLRSDKMFFIDLFGGILVYMMYFLIENHRIIPKNDYQKRQKRTNRNGILSAQAGCLILLVMVFFK